MKYYAVTDNPDELMHWGVLGMKWGVRKDRPRHSGSRKRSAAYKKAQSKLGRMMKSGIKKAEAHWKEYNSPKAKEKRFMDKAMQQARNGTLKYGKLTDAQVRKVTDRLYLERQARQLGSTENPRFAKRLRMAVGEGIVRGVGAGAGAYIEERFRGRGRTTAEIKGNKRKEKYEAKSSTQYRKAKTKQKQEYYDTAFEEGVNVMDRRFATARERAKLLSDVSSRKKQNEYAENLQKIREEQVARERGRYDGGRYAIERQDRKLGSGNNALQKLEAYNSSHERRNAAAERELIRVERQLANERAINKSLSRSPGRRQRPGGKKN